MNARGDVCTEFVAFSRGEFVGYALRLWVGQWMVLLALSVAHRVKCAHEQLPRLASDEKQSNWRHVLGAKYKIVYRVIENQEHVGVPTQGG